MPHKIFFFILSISFLAISAYLIWWLGRDSAHQFNSIPLEYRQCTADTDCLLVMDDCGGCSCGAAINRNSKASYNNYLSQLCEANPPKKLCDLDCPSSQPRCVENVCILE